MNTQSSPRKVAIVGATGYTGIELIRLLDGRSDVEVIAVTSDSHKGESMSDVFGSCPMGKERVYLERDTEVLDEADLVFFATPSGVAMRRARHLLDRKVRIVDLSADFRIRDVSEWSRWYGMPHACPELVGEAVYGLTEFARDKVRDAAIVANPGCYPTCVGLALYPLVEAGMVAEGPIVADCVSGISGAGRNASMSNIFCEVSDKFKAYGVEGHRHLPEMRQQIEDRRPGLGRGLVFVPHRAPMIRGMFATIHFAGTASLEDMWNELRRRYESSPFVEVLPLGKYPDTASVRASNRARIALAAADGIPDRRVLVCVIDNLVKGAAGQAVQNMNLMLGFDETAGLTGAPVYP